MVTEKGEKQAGVVYVEVAQLLNKKLEKIEDTYTLDKCPVKGSNVNISIEAELIGEGAASDTMSVDSTLFSQAGPSCLSTMSIQSKSEVEQSPAVETPVKRTEKTTSGIVDEDKKDKKIEEL